MTPCKQNFILMTASTNKLIKASTNKLHFDDVIGWLFFRMQASTNKLKKALQMF